MKKAIISFTFAFICPFIFANNLNFSGRTVDLVYMEQIQNDCAAYAESAADQEVSFFENMFSNGMAYVASYNYWLGYCEGASQSGLNVLQPVFIN